MTVVNHASADVETGASGTTLAFAAQSHTTGNLIAVAIRNSVSLTGVVSGVADTAGNTYQKATGIVNSNDDNLELWYAKNITGHATNVVTITFSGSVVYRSAAMVQLSGRDPTNPLDQVASGQHAGGTITSGTFTTSDDNEDIFVVAQIGALDETWTAGSGYTIEDQTTHKILASQFKAVSVIQSGVTASMTTSAGNAGSIVVATFRAVTFAGTSSAVAAGHTSATLSNTAIAGGTAPYSAQAQYSSDAGATWSNFGSPQTGIAESGTPTSVVVRNLVPGTPYKLRFNVTDSAATTQGASTASLTLANVPFPVAYDGVKETSATSGTGELTLAGAVAGFTAFADVLADGDTCHYAITNGQNREVGEGTFTAIGTKLSRDRVHSSTNSGLHISLSGTSTVHIDIPAVTLRSEAIPAKAYGLVGDGVTDDTAAFQALLNRVGDAGGGTIDLPPGEYIFGGALQDTGASNSQLVLPDKPFAGPTCVITLRGPLRPYQQLYDSVTKPTTAGGFAVIKSTLTGASGTASVISGPNAYTGGGVAVNNVCLNIENLVFEMPANPTLSCLRLRYQQANSIKDVMIHCGSVNLLSGLTEPTHSNSYGIIQPEFSHTPHNQLDRVTVLGMYTGLRIGELGCNMSANFWGCLRAVESPSNYYPNVFAKLGIYWCGYGIVASGGDSRLIVHVADIEYAGAGAPWQQTVYDVDDPNSYLIGHMSFINRYSSTINRFVLKNGGYHFLCTEIGGNRIAVDPTSDTTVSIPRNMAISRIYIENTTANAVTGGIRIGTTNGGTDVVVAQAVGANAKTHVLDADLLKRWFSRSAETTLYVQAVTSWNSANLLVYIHLEPLS